MCAGGMVELKIDEFPEDGRLLYSFFTVYVCSERKYNHKYIYVCKNDGSRANFYELESHIFSHCSKSKTIDNATGCIYMGSYCKYIWMTLSHTMMTIPHLFCLKIDYTSPFDELVEYYESEYGRNSSHHISKSHPFYIRVIEFIKQQPVSCPLCEHAFDSFPSVEIATSHITKCAAKRE